MKISYLEWNIRAAGNKDYTIPFWVTEYINSKNVDVMVLTEFRCGYNWDYFKHILEKNYYIYVSPYSSEISNQICIVLRREKEFDVKSVKTEKMKDCNIPELLQLDIVIDDGEQKELSIIGTRIKTQVGKECKQNQIKYLNERIQLLNSCFCIGDFNCSSTILQEILSGEDLKVFGPRIVNGYHSFVHEDNTKAGLDWIICKGLKKVSNPYNDSKNSPYATYDWDFLNSSNGYGNKTKNNYLNIKGLPDHAMLLGQLEV